MFNYSNKYIYKAVWSLHTIMASVADLKLHGDTAVPQQNNFIK